MIIIKIMMEITEGIAMMDIKEITIMVITVGMMEVMMVGDVMEVEAMMVGDAMEEVEDVEAEVVEVVVDVEVAEVIDVKFYLVL